MKTQDALQEEFQRLLNDDRLDEAEEVLKQFEPISDDAWLKLLREAPVDDEPLTAKERVRLDAAAERRREDRAAQRRVG